MPGELPGMGDFVLCSAPSVSRMLFPFPLPRVPSHCCTQAAAGEEGDSIAPCINTLGLGCVPLKLLGSTGSAQAMAILQLLSPGQFLTKRAGLTQSVVDSFN